MAEDFGIDDIKKLFSVFGYSLHEQPECPGTYVVKDSDGNAVHWGLPYVSVSYNVHELMLVLFTSNEFFIYDSACMLWNRQCGKTTTKLNIMRTNIQKNIYKWMSLHEMRVAYDLASCNM